MTVDISPSEFRRLCKENSFWSHTSGCVPGYAQANVLVLPKEIANDFADLCARNPVACPLIAMTKLGSPNKVDNRLVIDDEDFDLRTDLPKYGVYKQGNLIREASSVADCWDLDSHIGFLIGCSFSFEAALISKGLAPRNVLEKSNVSMYLTTKMLNPAGVFTRCPYVVSMRPYKATDVEKVRLVTREFRKTHGEPIDWGYDAVERLGIKDLLLPEFGSPCRIEDDEIPVFWACGVTTQVAAQQAGKHSANDDYIFAHVPGHMLVLDIKDSEICCL